MTDRFRYCPALAAIIPPTAVDPVKLTPETESYLNI